MAIFLAIFLLLQGPSPTPGESAQENQQQRQGNAQDSTIENQPTQPAPPQVDLPESPRDRSTGQAENGDGDQNAPPNWITWFTGALVLVAFLQFLVYLFQAKYMRRGLDLTKQAADASSMSAKTAEQALRIGQRAYLSVSSIGLSKFTPNKLPRAKLYVVNNGKTPATINNMCLISITEPDQLPDIPDFSHAGNPKEIEMSIGPGEVRNLAAIGIKISQEDQQAINSGARALWMYGKVEYTDKFGDRHHVSFGQRYSPRASKRTGKSVFVYIDKPGYNHSD